MNNIQEIKNINELPFKIKENFINNNLTIIFEEKSIEIINIFIKKYSNHKDIYFKKNNKLNINLIEYNFDLYLFLINCIELALELILKSNYVNLFDDLYLWNFSICHNIMFNYPFTLENIIFIPLNYITECYKYKNKNDFIKTLIHEKIHTSQRNNELLWEKYIFEQDKNWIKIIKSNSIYQIIENYINTFNINNNNQLIVNPDTDYSNFKYIYLLEEKIYYAHIIYNQIPKKIKTIFFIVNIDKNILEEIHVQKIFNNIDENNIIKKEHPYETFAYEISEKICNY